MFPNGTSDDFCCQGNKSSLSETFVRSSLGTKEAG